MSHKKLISKNPVNPVSRNFTKIELWSMDKVPVDVEHRVQRRVHNCVIITRHVVTYSDHCETWFCDWESWSQWTRDPQLWGFWFNQNTCWVILKSLKDLAVASVWRVIVTQMYCILLTLATFRRALQLSRIASIDSFQEKVVTSSVQRVLTPSETNISGVLQLVSIVNKQR